MDRYGDAGRLRNLYDERAPKGMSQAEFGAAYDIGNQSMVSQYMTGHRPLNIEAAAKFAKGLRCTIRDISPEMAQSLEVDIMPMLGERALKRALGKMVLAVAAALFTIPPTPAQASTLRFNITEYTLRFRAWLRRLRLAF